MATLGTLPISVVPATGQYHSDVYLENCNVHQKRLDARLGMRSPSTEIPSAKSVMDDLADGLE
jgi:hypothetical protein